MYYLYNGYDEGGHKYYCFYTFRIIIISKSLDGLVSACTTFYINKKSPRKPRDTRHVSDNITYPDLWENMNKKTYNILLKKSSVHKISRLTGRNWIAIHAYRATIIYNIIYYIQPSYTWTPGDTEAAAAAAACCGIIAGQPGVHRTGNEDVRDGACAPCNYQQL